jgi:iron complex transport system substrate-binding protein
MASFPVENPAEGCGPAQRIVTMLPGATETVCALGLGEALVGRSHECDHPPWVTSLPAVTASPVDAEAGSAAIHRQVRTALAEAADPAARALSIYDVDAEALRELRPDAILTQSQCEVCAVSEEAVQRAVAEAIGGEAPRIVSLSPATLADVLADHRRVGTALGAAEAGERLAASLHQRIEAIADSAGRLDARPTLACIEWMDPLILAGHWTPELIDRAGGRDPFGTPGEAGPWVEWDELRAADPDVIVVAPCGFDIDHTRRDLAALTERPGWESLSAVRNRRVYLADGHRYFNRPGRRNAPDPRGADAPRRLRLRPRRGRLAASMRMSTMSG